MRKKIISMLLCLIIILASFSLLPIQGASVNVPEITSKIAGNQQIYIAFSAVSGASGYKIYSSPSQTGTYSLLASLPSNRRAYHEMNMQNGVTKYYKVATVVNGVEYATDPFPLKPVLVSDIQMPYYSSSDPEHGYTPNQGYLGMSLPGNWRPFDDDSHWNVPLSDKNVTVVHNSDQIIQTILDTVNASTPGRDWLAFGNKSYTFPVHVVNSDNVEGMTVTSVHNLPYGNIFDAWDKDDNQVVDIQAPLTPDMWSEQNVDGHLIIVDPFKMVAWEFSRFGWLKDGTTTFSYVPGAVPTCSTFNVWDLTGSGTGVPLEGHKWKARGARGSGFPAIAGLIRPEEIEAGEINHALIYGFSKPRKGDDNGQWFAFPATRSDGNTKGENYPFEGSALRLPANITEDDFDAWGLGEPARVVARAMRDYGMYLGDISGNFKVYAQLLDPSDSVSESKWEAMFPGLAQDIQKIPVELFEVITTGGFYKENIGETEYPGAPSEPTPPPTQTPPPATGEAIKINFQRTNEAVPSGYIPDNGLTYGSRNGQKYGWNTQQTPGYAGAPAVPERTYVEMNTAAVWELEVPNGEYVVTAAVNYDGNPLKSSLEVEGLLYFDAVLNHQVRTETITVSDGKLTVTPAGRDRSRIAYIIISPIP